MHTESYYKKLRKKYTPAEIKLIFLFESPPESGEYFYDDTGKITEPLFTDMMNCFIPFVPTSKKEGLKEFTRLGYLLVDSTYKSINNLDNGERRQTILKEYPKLEKDLKILMKESQAKIVIVGNTLRKILEDKLKENFYVINDGENVPFPLYRRRNEFCEKIRFLFDIHNVNLVMYC
jgi:hypothetical protein